MSKYKLRDENGKIYFGWYISLMGLILTTFGYACIISITGVFVMPVTSELGFSIGNFTFYITIMSIANSLSLFLFTKYMNEKHMKKVLLLSCICGILSFIGFGLSSKLWQFYVLSCIQGICMGCMTITPISILINNWFGPQVRGFALSIALFGPSIGGMIAIAVINRVVMTFGWRTGYLSIAVCLLVFCIPLILKFAVWSPEKKGLKRMGDTEEAVTVSTEDIPGIPFSQVKRTPIFWIMLISCSLTVFASAAVLVYS